jgi:predicted porin
MMKNKVSFSVLPVAILYSSLACAQGTVTLFGLVEDGFNYTNNVKGKSAYEMESGYVQGSRWGLQGSEDLGGSLKTIFKLENGFDLNSGKLSGNLEFARQGWMGLSHSQFGTLSFGRQYDSLVDYFAQTTANGNWGGYLFSHPYDNDNSDNSFRVNNSMKYNSPNIGGFKFGGTYGFSNTAGGFANNRLFSVGAQYTYNELLIGAGFISVDNPSANAAGAVSNGGDENFLANKIRIFGFGVNYTVGPAVLGLAYSNSYMEQPKGTTYISGSILPGNGTLSSLRFQNIEVNAVYNFTPSFYVGAQYVFTRENYDATSLRAHPNIQEIGLMADYNLSKRTDVYVQAEYSTVGGDRTGTALDNAYVSGSDDMSSTSRQVVARVGFRHKF